MHRTAAVVVLVALIGCGGSDGPSTPTTVVTMPTPVPCTQTLLLQGGASFPPWILDREVLNVTTAGRIDMIVDWTFSSSTIGVYLVRGGTCTLSSFNAGTCPFLVGSDSGPKPRKHSFSGATPGAYEMLVANFSSVTESLSTQVFLKSETCPALSANGSLLSLRPPVLERP